MPWTKRKDLLYYYKYVRKYSTIQDSFVIQTKDHYPLFRYYEAIIDFNKYLPGKFAITSNDTGYNSVYKQYSNWLIARFVSEDFLFYSICPRYELRRIRDPELRYHVFLAKTIKFYLEDKLGQRDCSDDHIDYTVFVAYKMYIGARTIISQVLYPDSPSMADEIEENKKWILDELEANRIKE